MPTHSDQTVAKVCSICGVPDWLNPIEDHANWVGHEWTPTEQDESDDR